MTNERKNEIWAMLDADAQEWIKGQYEEILEDIADYKEQNTDNGFPIMENRAIGQKQMLIRLFGKHNLTAKSEQNEDSVSSNAQNCENFTENGILDAKIQSESAESVEASTTKQPYFTFDPPNYNNEHHIVGRSKSIADAKELANSFQSFTDWNKYRLDLAKEIAVAGMTAPNVLYADIAKNAVKIANEIVKRLKETEI